MTAKPDSSNSSKPIGSGPAGAGTDSSADSNIGKQIRNFLIALVAIALSIAIFFGVQTETGSNSLSALAAAATPLEVAQSNNKPTLMEFYANWCTSCQAMANDMSELKDAYGDRVNFVMLNVDNDKWLPELLTYRVDGIPHFVYLTATGEAIANTIGEQPRQIMAANLDALASQTELPFTPTSGQVSKVEAPVAPKPTAADDPRSHGSQVQP